MYSGLQKTRRTLLSILKHNYILPLWLGTRGNSESVETSCILNLHIRWKWVFRPTLQLLYLWGNNRRYTLVRMFCWGLQKQ